MTIDELRKRYESYRTEILERTGYDNTIKLMVISNNHYYKLLQDVKVRHFSEEKQTIFGIPFVRCIENDVLDFVVDIDKILR